jgi:NAD(P)-dependent dehydrogenase (short-subunit alcohol dehydrogenase family)
MKREWTNEQIPNLSGKIIIVTGANSGIGYEAAKEFSRKGAKTILACRNMEKARSALVKIKKEVPNSNTEIMKLDVSSLKSIHGFAKEFKSKHKRLDVLLNNAGVMMTPYEKTEDGFELQVGTNHLGHFALTGLLINLLLKTHGSRVVNVSSNGHRFGDVDFDKIVYDKDKKYSSMRAYGRSKLANLLFTYELQRRLEAKKAKVIAVAAHPGTSNTNLGRYIGKRWYLKLAMPIFSLISQSAAMGAMPSIRASVDPDVKGGDYYGPNGFFGMKGKPIKVESNEESHNREHAKRLWDISEKLTKVKYNF